MDYGFAYEGRIFTPNQSKVDPAENAARNAAIEKAELEAWAGKPERFVGYVQGKRFTTWTGADLGEVEVRSQWSQPCWRNCGRHYEPYMMTSIIVRGNNGASYHGRYGSDWSQACRVKRSG